MKESLVLHCFVSNHIKKRALLPSLLAVSTICAYSKKFNFLICSSHVDVHQITLNVFRETSKSQSSAEKAFFLLKAVYVAFLLSC